MMAETQAPVRRTYWARAAHASKRLRVRRYGFGRSLDPTTKLLAQLHWITPRQPQCWLWDRAETAPEPIASLLDFLGDVLSRLWDEAGLLRYRIHHR